MASLVLGPLLRYVSEAEATVWVETDSPCEVVVLDHSARTFEVEGHHYALVRIEGLPAARDDGLARRPGARPGAAGDGGRARVALHRGVCEWQLRPPVARHLAPVALLASHALAGVME